LRFIGDSWVTVVKVVFLVFLWYLLLKPIKVYISFASVFHISINATTIDFTGSGKLGLPTKALLKKNGGVDIAKSISCLMNELILEFLAVFTISVLALLIVAYHNTEICSFHRFWLSLDIPVVVLVPMIVDVIFFFEKILRKYFLKKL